ncbi:MAG: zf-HC2 domain-containing protein [Myxococcota bacterium]
MNNYCEDIEVKIVDYFESTMDDSERSIFLEHINLCKNCKDKFVDYEKAQSFIKNDFNLLIEPKADILFENISRVRERRRVFFRLAFAVVAIFIIIISVLTYSHLSYQSRIKDAKVYEVNIDYFVDIEEGLLNTDEDTFEIISQAIYGDDFREFEEVLEETSIIKP